MLRMYSRIVCSAILDQHGAVGCSGAMSIALRPAGLPGHLGAGLAAGT